MEICIITCNRANNYGARLQAYALWRHLTELGHDARVIDYCPPYLDFHTRLFFNPGLNVKEWAKLVLRYNERLCYITKFENLQGFSRSMTRLTPVTYTSIEELRANPPKADAYIAGSDQIWNTTFANGRDPAFYLDFGDDNTLRISYAASFATQDIANGYTDLVNRGLRRFDAVSVRESSGKHITDSLGIKANICCDPAFLLDRSQWDEICSAEKTVHKFVLVYDFERSREVREVAKRIAHARGLKIFTISNRPLRYGARDFSDCTPGEFLRLIKDADCVVSNSLHGTIFSLIYGKDFYVVDRADGLNVRMHDLVHHYGLDHRLISPSADNATLQSGIDYTKVYPKLQSDISESKKWLTSQLILKQ
ncbi:MAG: polysaccharide pyruvyl transferase family protein [Muribaculaceae bacterium]|nr:polysaccharide pyruvyl transferase family protein [Muribaculaceae bacterium]